MKKFSLLLLLILALSITGCSRNIDASVEKYNGEKTLDKIEKSTLNDKDKEMINLAVKVYSDDELIGMTIQDIIDRQTKDICKDTMIKVSDKILSSSSELVEIIGVYIDVWDTSIKMTLNAQRFAELLGVTTDDFVKSVDTPKGSNYSFSGDFDNALKYTHQYFNNTKRFDNVSISHSEITDNMKQLKDIPDELKDVYEVLINIYQDYDKLYDLGISPSGSLATYSKSANDLVINITSLCKELGVRMYNN